MAAHEALGRAIERADSGVQHELAALELRVALGNLAEITDAVDNEDVLDRIFGEFCIGK
jgi:tRNA modification GTPase